MLSNNHVGNEWGKYVICNGKEIESGDTVTVPSGSAVRLEAVVMEHDNVPDSGVGEVILSGFDRIQGQTQIVVCENRGRYAGNRAVWEFTCFAEPLN